MALDPRFIVTSDLDTYYVDKDTGAPLAGGIVTFYSNSNRTQLKPVYQLTGSPPYSIDSYAALPNPIVLNGDGTFSDNNGNNIVPYYFPYLGVPTDNNNTIDLYYITVESSTNVPQFTRQAWPNFTSQDSIQPQIDNFVPNGQFLLHNNNGSQVVDTVTDSNRKIYDIAQGGWTFEIPIDSTSTNEITFEPFDSYVTNPTASPQFACRIRCTNPDLDDTFKDFCLRFNDVNKFASDVDQYTYYFEAINNQGSSVNVGLYIRKNYGVGGDPTSEEFIGTITIDNTYSAHSVSFSFGNNEGNVLGENSFVQLVLRFPATFSSDVSITDVVLASNAISIASFPVQTDQQMITNSLGTMPTPDPDGFDLYLPFKYGPEGFYFDDSDIGNPIPLTNLNEFDGSLSTTSNLMLADGSQYLTAGYSDLGVPFARLQSKLFLDSGTYVGPLFGTGNDFVTIDFINTSNSLYLKINTGGPVSPRTGAGTSTFTVSQISVTTGSTPYKGYTNGSNTFILIANSLLTSGSYTNPTASVGSNVTIATYTNAPGTRPTYLINMNSTPSASSYITFNDPTNNHLYYIWFKVNGSGTDPALSGTGIEVDLLNTDAIDIIQELTANAVSGRQMDRINTGGLTGSGIFPNSYFTFTVNSTNYYAWFDVDNSGIDPAPGGTGIKISVNSIDSALSVLQAISRGINSVYFAAPDYRGLYLRGIDLGAGVDVNASSRYELISLYRGGDIGSQQIDTFANHLHSITNLPGTNPSQIQVYITAGSITTGTNATLVPQSSVDAIPDNALVYLPANTVNILSTGNTNYTGTNQTTPVNTAIAWAIRY